jgi:hypothetical protein
MGEWMLTYRMFDIVSSPFSFTCSRLPNDAENQLEAALGAVSALRKPYGTMFNVRLALHPDVMSYILTLREFIDRKLVFDVLSVSFIFIFIAVWRLMC